MSSSTIKNCCICSQIIGDQENDLISQLLKEGKYVRRIIFENENFSILPSLGALCEGHLLLCPKRHVKNLSQITNEEEVSFLSLKKRAKELLQKKYNTNIYFFEHGSSSYSDRIICTVSHAHLHIVPTNIDISQKIFSDFDWLQIGDSIEDLRTTIGKNEYLYFENNTGLRFITLAKNNEIESQYFRKIYAEQFGINKWNWRIDPNPEYTNSIYNIFRNEFRNVTENESAAQY